MKLAPGCGRPIGLLAVYAIVRLEPGRRLTFDTATGRHTAFGRAP